MDFGPHLFVASLEGAITAAVLALTAVGLSIVFGIMRVVNVAHGEFFMLGAVIAWWLTSLIGTHHCCHNWFVVRHPANSPDDLWS